MLRAVRVRAAMGTNRGRGGGAPTPPPGRAGGPVGCTAGATFSFTRGGGAGNPRVGSAMGPIPTRTRMATGPLPGFSPRWGQEPTPSGASRPGTHRGHITHGHNGLAQEERLARRWAAAQWMTVFRLLQFIFFTWSDYGPGLHNLCGLAGVSGKFLPHFLQPQLPFIDATCQQIPFPTGRNGETMGNGGEGEGGWATHTRHGTAVPGGTDHIWEGARPGLGNGGPSPAGRP